MDVHVDGSRDPKAEANPETAQNPSLDAIKGLVEAARKGQLEEAAKALLEAERSKAEARAKKKAEFDDDEAQFLKTHAGKGGYGGYNKDQDDFALAAMSMAGFSIEPSNIVVMPGTTGMSLKGGNSAVALMSADKIEAFKRVAMTTYGPGQYDGAEKIDYAKLLARFQLGTILIAASELADGDKACGIIWHECGHKKLGQPAEAGEVFVFELTMVLKELGPDKAREWVMTVRKPAYFREYGLKNGPGQEELLKLLRTICTEAEFYDEFREDYQRLVGKELEPSEELAKTLQQRDGKEEKKSGQPGAIGIGSVITGTLADLKKQVPEDDLKGPGRASVKPMQAQADDTVEFAGKKWRVLSRSEADNKLVWKLRCEGLAGGAAVQRGSVWAKDEGHGQMFGFDANGPFVYRDQSAAERDLQVVQRALEQAVEKFPKVDPSVLYESVVKHVLNTAGV